MKRRLATSKSMFAMLQMYVNGQISSKPDRNNVIAMDIGGTNLRIAYLRWDEDGTIFVKNMRKYSMPGVTEAKGSTDTRVLRGCLWERTSRKRWPDWGIMEFK